MSQIDSQLDIPPLDDPRHRYDSAGSHCALIVSDDRPLIARLTDAFGQLGWPATTRHPQVLQPGDASQIGLVLLDAAPSVQAALQHLARFRTMPHSYLVALHSGADYQAVLQLMQAGAQDYLPVPLPPQPLLVYQLGRFIRLWTVEATNRSYSARIQRQRVQLRRRTFRDHLTGLLNQTALYRRLKREIIRARRYERHLGLIMLDLDFFKLVNDQYGHQAGSSILKQIGRFLRRSIRTKVDWAARFGGDEFSITLPETPFTRACTVAERLRRQMEEARFLIPGGHRIAVTASFGVAIHRAGMSPKGIVQEADNALYRAKALGRNRVEPLSAP